MIKYEKWYTDKSNQLLKKCEFRHHNIIKDYFDILKTTLNRNEHAYLNILTDTSKYQ